MKPKKKIVVIDPRPALSALLQIFVKTGWCVEEVFSRNCSVSMAINRCDISDICFALSGSDLGIAIAHGINIKIGLANNLPVSVLYNKIDQYEAIYAFDPSLVFDGAKIFNSKDDLKSYLKNNDNKIIIRPDISYINGSALISTPESPITDCQIDHVFSATYRILTHPFVEGVSYFINGVVVNGEFVISDAWQCFNLLANTRHILTSVINISANKHQDILAMKPTLQKLCKKFHLNYCPIHFEVVLSNGILKIVKMVPRLATEPLPTLCNLAGMKSQLDVFGVLLQSGFTALPPICEPNCNVADYSFIVRKSGYLKQTNKLNSVYDLSSYHHIYYFPAIGSFVPETNCGATYGATVILANNNRNELISDIMFCQKLNEFEVFEL